MTGEKLVLLVGTAKGAYLYFTDRARESWARTGPHLDGWDILSLRGDSGNGRLLAAARHPVQGPALLSSSDFGATWEPAAGSPPEAGKPEATDPFSPPGRYIGTPAGELSCSCDDGKTWKKLPGQSSRITTLSTWVVVGGAPASVLSAEEQMANFEQDLIENDSGHRPC